METLQDQKAYPDAQRSFKIKFANKVRKKDEFAMVENFIEFLEDKCLPVIFTCASILT